METLGTLILSAAGLAHLVAWIWLLILAFRVSIIWGLVVLLCPPIGSIIFVILNWEAAKRPAILLIIAWVLGSIGASMGAVHLHATDI